MDDRRTRTKKLGEGMASQHTAHFAGANCYRRAKTTQGKRAKDCFSREEARLCMHRASQRV